MEYIVYFTGLQVIRIARNSISDVPYTSKIFSGILSAHSLKIS
jgi:hypothetical protein